MSDLQEGEGSVVEATTGRNNAANAVSNESSDTCSGNYAKGLAVQMGGVLFRTNFKSTLPSKSSS